MKIKNQKWVVGELAFPQDEIEIINEANQSRIARITITDFKSLKQARKVAEAIASLPELIRGKNSQVP